MTMESWSTSNEINPYNLYEIPSTPDDSISKLAWCESKDILAASSWNNSVSLWNVKSNGNKFNAVPLKRYMHQAPALCVFITKDGKVLSGGCDNIAKALNLGGQNIGPGNTNLLDFGKHESCIKTIHHVPQLNVIITGGWDKKLNFWDSRFSSNKPVLINNMPERVYAADVNDNLFVVGCGGKDKQVGIYDLRKPKTPVKTDKSPLNYQTRCISIFNDKKGYVLGSIEGRVQIQYFETSSAFGNKKSFAFKCHREGTGKNKKNCYAVNDVDFNSKNGQFATSGSNGRYHFWNKEEKRRTFQMKKKFSCPITSGQFNANGSIFAVALSYDFSQGTEVPLFQNKFGSKILLHPTGFNISQ